MNVRYRRWMLRTIALFLALAVLLLAGMSWLLGTQSGARHGLNWLQSQVEVIEHIGKVTGSATGGLQIADLRLVSDSVEVHVDNLSLELDVGQAWKFVILVPELTITNTVVTLLNSDEDSAITGTDTQSIPEISVPIDLKIESLVLDNLSLNSGKDDAEVVIKTLLVKGSWDDADVIIDEFELDSRWGDASGAASLSLVKPFPVSMEARSSFSIEGFPTINSQSNISGSFSELVVSHATETPYNLTISGNVSGVLEQPVTDLDLAVDSLNLASLSESFPRYLVSGELDMTGKLEASKILGRIRTQQTPIGIVSSNLSGTLQKHKFVLDELLIDFPGLESKTQLGVTGHLGYSDVIPHSNLVISWKNLVWPLQDEPRVSAPTGRAEIDGDINSFAVALESDLMSQKGTPGSLKLSATGSKSGITVSALSLDALGGTAAGEGEITFVDQLQMVAKIRGSGFDPGELVEEWPGTVSFEIEGQGKIANGFYEASIPVFTGEGELRGYPMSFDGSLDLTPKKLEITDVSIRSGSTQIEMNGHIDERVDIQWLLESDNLNSVWPGLSGSLNGQGLATGVKEIPQLTFELSGESLAYKELSLQSFEAKGSYNEKGDERGLVEVQLVKPGLDNYAAQSITAIVSGSVEKHDVTVEVDDDLGRSQINLAGAWQLDESYQFNLNTLDLQAGEFGDWALVESVSGRLGRGITNVPNSCLVHEQSRLCVGVISDEKELAANIDLSDFPLSLLSHAVPVSVSAAGNVNGGGQIKLGGGASSYGSVSFDIDNLELKSRIVKDSNTSTLEFNSSTIGLEAMPTGEVLIKAAFPLRTGGGVDFDGQLARDNPELLSRSLLATAKLELPSAAFLTDYFLSVSQIDGVIDGEAAVSGTLQAPVVLGTLSLTQGTLAFSEPGVLLTDVDIQLKGKPDNRIDIFATADSGGGNIELAGELGVGSNTQFGELTLTGSDFQVLNTEHSKLWATPEVTVVYRDSSLNLDGSVHIPRGSIEIEEVPHGAVRVSRDQVIVGVEGDETQEALIPLNAKLNISLGDDVRFSAFGLNAFLEGGLELSEKPNQSVTANGEILLRDGEYQAYGQTLNLNTGRLVYAGGPIEQPGVDLRATRTPVEGIEVGVAARGSLNQPNFTIFSTPQMPESDQLAYLIFGRPINAEATSESTLITRLALSLGMRGGESLSQKLAGELGVDQINVETGSSEDFSQAALVIGKYLSPKLFVSYGIGLLEPVSTLKLEYALSSRWQLVTESSTTRNSADAQFTYER